MTGSYKPEGTAKQESYSLQALENAMREKKTLEGRTVLCDKNHDLTVSLGRLRGIIPRNEAVFSPDGAAVRDIAILTRVGKPVCFKVVGMERDAAGLPVPILSRRAAQEECFQKYVKSLSPGDITDVRITHMEQFGCFVDVGCGLVSLIPIDQISTSRISHPSDRFVPGQELHAVVRSLQPDGKLLLSHKELLGTWEENVSRFCAGQTAAGVIRSIEPYGIFVELSPNLAGLAEWRDNVTVGQTASVYIKNIIAEKMKIKLILVDFFAAPPTLFSESDYFITSGRMAYWRYSPPGCEKVIETVF